MAKGLKGEQTRERIIATAIKLFAQHGFTDTSFQNIADACNLSQSATLHHFRTKTQLIESVLQTILENNHRIVAKSMDMRDNAYERLTKHFNGNIDWALRHKDQAQIIILLYYLACFNRKFRDAYLKILETGRERILAHLLSGEREKIFSFERSVELVAEALHEALVGGFIAVVAGGAKSSQTERIRKKWRFLIRALTGYSS